MHTKFIFNISPIMFQYLKKISCLKIDLWDWGNVRTLYKFLIISSRFHFKK